MSTTPNGVIVLVIQCVPIRYLQYSNFNLDKTVLSKKYILPFFCQIEAAAYFTNFEISKTTTNHSWTLMKKAQKSKNGSKLAQFEVAPSFLI